MSDVLKQVIAEFMELAAVPRPSHHEERAAEHLYSWAKSRGLNVEIDDLGDVIIDKPASAGCENMPAVILQAHMDMVCVCEEGIKYSPLNDPIKVINDGTMPAPLSARMTASVLPLRCMCWETIP